MTATKGVERYPLANTGNWFGFKPFNLANPGQATVVAFYKGGALQYTPYNVRFRYNCNAYDFAGPYICTEVTGIYHLIVSGLDHTGNVWQRMYLYQCDSQGSKICMHEKMYLLSWNHNPTTCNWSFSSNNSSTTKLLQWWHHDHRWKRKQKMLLWSILRRIPMRTKEVFQ